MNNNPEKITEELLTCKICKCDHGHKAPTALLSCGHFFCRMCLEQSFAKTKSQRTLQDARLNLISCPVCCLPSAVPPGGLKDLPRAMFQECVMDHLLRRNNRAFGNLSSLHDIPKICYDPESLRAQFHC